MNNSQISTEELFTALNEEKKTGELLPLNKDLYKKVEAEEKEDPPGDSARHRENKKKLLNMLKARRTQKILTYIAYGRNLPHPVPEEEERLYIRIKKIIEEESGSPKTTKIRVVVDTPEIITAEGKKLGPFGKNTVVEVEDQQDLEFLIKNKIGETTNQ